LPSVMEANNETFKVLSILGGFRTASAPGEIPSDRLPSREIVRLFLLSLAVQVPDVRRNQTAIA
jgi:hypothetical protein